MVNLNDIGENSKALFCLTPYISYLKPWHNLAWVLPTGDTANNYQSVGVRTSMRTGALLLNRPSRVSHMTPGIYTCRIPMSSSGTAILYAVGYNLKHRPRSKYISLLNLHNFNCKQLIHY